MYSEFFLTAVLFLTPGYLIATTVKKFSGLEMMCSSILFSTILYGSVSLLIHYAGFLQGAPTTITVFALAIVFFLFAGAKPLKADIDKRLLLLILVSLSMCLIVYGQNPYPISGDSFTHYSIAKSFFSNEWYTSDVVDSYLTPRIELPYPQAYRPPLADFLFSLGMLFNGQDYASAVSMPMLFGVLLLLPVYLIADMLFDKKVALTACVFTMLNYFLLRSSVAAEIRIFPCFFILLMFYFALKGRDFWPYATASAAIAYLSNYTSICFIAAISLYYVVKERRSLKFRNVLVIISLFVIILAPWLVRNYVMFGNPLYTTARYTLFTISAQELALLKPPTFSDYLDRFGGGGLGFLKMAGFRLLNILTTYFPPPQKIIQYGIGWMLSTSMINLVGPLVFALAVVYMAKNFNAVKGHLFLFTILFTSLLCPPVFRPTSSDGLSEYLSPLIIVFLVYAAAFIESKKSKALLFIVLISLLAQTTYLSYIRASTPKPDTEVIDSLVEDMPADSLFMSLDAQRFNYYTGRRGYVTPYASTSEIENTIEKYNISYYILTPADTTFRNVTAEDFSGYQLVYSKDNVSLFKTR